MTGNRRATYVPEPEANRTTTIIEKVADKETRTIAIVAIMLGAVGTGLAVTGAIDNIGQTSRLDAQQGRVEQVARDVAYLAQADEAAANRAAVEAETARQLAGQGGAIDPANLAEALATPCPTEDSDNCVWYGGANQSGDAFVTVEGHDFPLTSGLE